MGRCCECDEFVCSRWLSVNGGTKAGVSTVQGGRDALEAGINSLVSLSRAQVIAQSNLIY